MIARRPDGSPERKGSVALVVRDEDRLDSDEHPWLVLTAAHVVDGLTVGDAVDIEPDPGLPHRVYLGEVRRIVPLAPLPSVAVDAAVIKPSAPFEWINSPDGVWVKEARDLWLAEETQEIRVSKRGAATGLTRGDLLPIAADHYMHDVRARYTCGWWVQGREGRLFADEGDSGSAVIDDEHRFVGLAVAIERRPHGTSGLDLGVATFVHGARQVLTALNVSLDDEPPAKRGRA